MEKKFSFILVKTNAVVFDSADLILQLFIRDFICGLFYFILSCPGKKNNRQLLLLAESALFLGRERETSQPRRP